MQKKYLFFDLDGTLTDPMQGITRAAQYALRHFGIEVEELSELCPLIGPPLRWSFCEFYGLSPEQAEVACGKYHEYFAPKGIFENIVYEGIPDLLADLQATGATLVIATSKPTHFAEQIARHFGFAERFTLICGSNPDGTRDAKAEVIRHALQTLGISDPATAVMIGDRRFDIEGAKATGLGSIGVLWGYGSREELQAAGAERIAADIAALRAMLIH